jgi:hypothetical protein
VPIIGLVQVARRIVAGLRLCTKTSHKRTRTGLFRQLAGVNGAAASPPPQRSRAMRQAEVYLASFAGAGCTGIERWEVEQFSSLHRRLKGSAYRGVVAGGPASFL